jgi:hypothetical protein
MCSYIHIHKFVFKYIHAYIGRSTISLYVQWALSVTGGVGYGYMGLGSPSILQQGVDMNTMSGNKGMYMIIIY